MSHKKDILSLTLTQLGAQLVNWQIPRERSSEVWRWIYQRGEMDFHEMDDLPGNLRHRLLTEMYVPKPRLLRRQEAPDGWTRKDLLQFEDGERVETVLLRYGPRRSVCLSTQVGCASGCKFCATGQMGFVRDLTCSEIVGQALHFQRDLLSRGKRLTNAVLMGMGEPLANYDASIAAVRRLIDQRAFGIPPSRVTLSTVGIPEMIERLAEDDLGIQLAISLHAATDNLRDRLIPINRKYPLNETFAATERYAEVTGRTVMFEWVLIDGMNDTIEHARTLVDRLSGIPAHVNLIHLNASAAKLRPSDPAAVETFIDILDLAGVPHTMRQQHGHKIRAGCGQLCSRT